MGHFLQPTAIATGHNVILFLLSRAATFLVFFAAPAGARVIASDFRALSDGLHRFGGMAVLEVPLPVFTCEFRDFMVVERRFFLSVSGYKFYRPRLVFGATVFGFEDLQGLPVQIFGPVGAFFLLIVFPLRRMEGVVQVV